MKLTPRMLLFVLGIPASYLPLLAAVESGPVEVGVTLFLLTAFGCREAIRAQRTADQPKWQRRMWLISKISFVYACCAFIVLPLSLIATGARGPTPFQRWLYGESGGLLRDLHSSLSLVVFRFLAISVCGLVSWFAAMAVASRQRAAFWIVLFATPVIFADLWLLFSAVGPVMPNDSWLWPLLALILASAPVVIAARRRPPRLRQAALPAFTPPSNQPVESPGARVKRPFQFTMGALFALTTICALWSALVLYASRETRGTNRLRTVPVSGTLTHNGAPVRGASVTFYPADPSSGRAAGGVTDKRGIFLLDTYVGGSSTVRGALPGDYIVTITPGASTLTVIPARYDDLRRSGLQATVKATSKMHLTFDLIDDP